MLQSLNNIDERLYELMVEEMNSDEQIQFVKNFQIYLEYGDNDTAFIINLDDIWKWIGFSRKDNAKSFLIKKFQEKNNYIYNNRFLPSQDPINNISRDNEIILLNVSTFKKFCMKASTKRADEICDYYLKMEKIMNQYTKEKLNELQKTVYKHKKMLENGENNIFWTDNSISDYNNKNVIYIGYIGEFDNEKYYKFGISEQVYTREVEQHKRTFDTFEMKHIELCDNMSFVEKLFKQELKTKNLLKSLEINSRNQTELFITTPQNDIIQIIQNLKDLINKNPLQTIKESKNEIDKLKEELEYYKKETQKITSNYEELKEDHRDIKIDYRELKQEHRELKQEYKNIKEELYNLKQENQELIGKNKNQIIKETNEINETSIENNEVVNEIIEPIIQPNILDEESLTTIESFCERYIEEGLDTSSNDKYRVRIDTLYDFYCKKCVEPISRVDFNEYIRTHYKVEEKNCNWLYKIYNTWFGIKLINIKEKDKQIDIYTRNFIENYCTISESAKIDTKVYHDTFKEYCNNNNFVATKDNDWSPSRCRKALEKLGFGYKEWIIEGKKHGYTGFNLKGQKSIDEDVKDFIDEKCILTYGARIKTTALWGAFTDYVKNKYNIERVKHSKIRFYEIIEKDYKLTRKNINKADMGFVGIKIINKE
jgi:hypothetical protein